MPSKHAVKPHIARAIGGIPYRLALAGGWIDQPFVSRLNPDPFGSMVVVSIKPEFRVMDRSGCASGTRAVAQQLWGSRLPRRPAPKLVRELYAAENAGKNEPSGSQDMIGLVYPGISRLDYSIRFEGGVFPERIESITSSTVTGWLQRVLWVLPVQPRPSGYNPLGEKRLDPKWVARLGNSGKRCFNAISQMDLNGLGESMNECMGCWERMLPHVLRHPTLTVDLPSLLQAYQRTYPGAMYSGCGGGYLFVVSRDPVPGAFNVSVRLK